MKSVKIEVCIDSVESALAAVQGGADRLEICGNLALGGGTTPSIGLVRKVKQSCRKDVELMAMIRPRPGDFIYSPLEISIMLDDIRLFSQIGITGVVLGVLNADGTVDVENTTRLVQEAVKYNNMKVCFHRAFDMVVDQKEALSTLRKIPGITRILTSGGNPSALTGLPQLISLCECQQSQSQTLHSNTATSQPDSKGRIEIMPGSGINRDSVSSILHALLPYECFVSVHMSGGDFVESGMLFRREGMGMGVGGTRDWGIWRTSEVAVRGVREVVDEVLEAYENSR